MSTIGRPRRVFSLRAAIIMAGVFALYGCGLWPGGSDVPSDSIEFAIHLAMLGRDRDWEGMRELMVEEFRDFDLDALEWAVRFQSISPVDVAVMPGHDGPDSWTAQPFGEAVIVQLKEAPLFALTLRKTGDGGLEFDPGPSALRWASWLDSQYARGLEWADLGYPLIQGLSTNIQTVESPVESHPFGVNWLLRHDVKTVHRAGTRLLEATVGFDILRGLSGKLDMKDVLWRTDTAEGQAELLWTNALLEEGASSDSWGQSFSNPTGQGTATYFFTVGMDIAPADDEVTIEFNDLTVGDTVVDMALTMPLVNVPPDG